MDAYIEDTSKSILREIASRMFERGVAVETVVEAGPPAGRVCEYADRHCDGCRPARLVQALPALSLAFRCVRH